MQTLSTYRISALAEANAVSEVFKRHCDRTYIRRWLAALLLVCVIPFSFLSPAQAEQILAGVGKVEITDRSGKLVNDPLYAKALVIQSESSRLVIITVDAVAIGGIGYIRNDFLENVRTRVKADLKIAPESLLVNASHCHGIVCADAEDRTVQAVRIAMQNLVPVTVAAGTGSENRIMENRRLRLKNGAEADVRHAYSLPSDDDVASIGPIDPEIGLLRLNKLDGDTLAVVYNFACHPIQGVPNGGNTADFPGFASKVIEENLSDGTMAFFIQGCAGDINPVLYKDVHNPRDSEPYGNMLGLSVLRGLKSIEVSKNPELQVVREMITLPRGADLEKRMAANQAEQARLLSNLKGTSLNFKTFLSLYVQYQLSPEFPAYSSHRYMLDESLGKTDLKRMDSENRANMEQYHKNVMIMEELTRLQTNYELLKMHHAQNEAAGSKTLDVEVVGFRLGEFVMITFPGELTVEVGLNLKRAAPRPLTFVAGYTNGYIYYTPTVAQRQNVGYAQEDCDCIVGPEWQQIFETKAIEIFKRLEK
jgi:hypothetical protein